jgi:hypothetical protein
VVATTRLALSTLLSLLMECDSPVIPLMPYREAFLMRFLPEVLLTHPSENS